MGHVCGPARVGRAHVLGTLGRFRGSRVGMSVGAWGRGEQWQPRRSPPLPLPRLILRAPASASGGCRQSRVPPPRAGSGPGLLHPSHTWLCAATNVCGGVGAGHTCPGCCGHPASGAARLRASRAGKESRAAPLGPFMRQGSAPGSAEPHARARLGRDPALRFPGLISICCSCPVSGLGSVFSCLLHTGEASACKSQTRRTLPFLPP